MLVDDAIRQRRSRSNSKFKFSLSTKIELKVIANQNHNQQPLTHISNKMQNNIENNSSTPPIRITLLIGGTYVLSGVIQPILMAIAENAGIANAKCQIYMFFYYFGPFIGSFILVFSDHSNSIPSLKNSIKAAVIAMFDLSAQSLNYTGAALAGPTIFAIIYSSVTVWTAVLSRIILNRYMSTMQWLGVVIVFLGLVITGLDSIALGPKVYHGALLIIFGSAWHALTYVLSESIMTSPKTNNNDLENDDAPLSSVMNCCIQTGTAMTFNLIWQITFTRTHFHELVMIPMKEHHTSFSHAILIFTFIGLANLVHALSFFHTLKHFPGGATSAGVGKGLQAVLVFVATSLFICGKFGGNEMCFSFIKFLSLVSVLSGVFLFGKATAKAEKSNVANTNTNALKTKEIESLL